MERNQIMDGKKMVAAEEKHLIPLDKVNGYDVRPGFYGINGATALREGVNFTVCSLEATAVELLLYHRGEKEPYAILPFPDTLPDRKCVFHDCFLIWISVILSMLIGWTVLAYRKKV